MRLGISAALAGISLLLGIPAMAAPAEEFPSQSGPVSVATVAEGLEHPWGLAFLPDGRMLVSERPGRLRIVGMDGKLSPPIAGVPEVYARGQGGLQHRVDGGVMRACELVDRPAGFLRHPNRHHGARSGP